MLKVLIIEDDAIFKEILARSLIRREFEVRTAESLRAAEAVIKEFEPDTVLLDVHVHGENGLNFIPVIRSLNPAPRIVVLTSFGDPRTAAWAIRNGATGFLSKPADINEIVYALRDDEKQVAAKPDSFMSPEDARDAHIIQFFAANDYNVSQTARALGMHRRTLQRILERLRSFAPQQKTSRFGRVRRRVNLWSRWLGRRPTRIKSRPPSSMELNETGKISYAPVTCTWHVAPEGDPAERIINQN